MQSTLLIALLLTGTAALAQPAFDREGHRGARGLMPENTVGAMKKAMDLGVSTLELDVVISKDRQVVVSHDTYMAATIALKPDGTPVTPAEEKTILLYALPYAEIARYDVGSKPHPQFPEQQKLVAHKPLLSALIDSVYAYARATRKPVPMFNIEIKSSPTTDGTHHPAPADFVALVMAVCQQKKLGDKLLIQSFDVRPLQVLHQKYPNVRLSYLTFNTKSVAENLATLGFTPQTYSPIYKNVTAETVKASHDAGMKIVPWTVNTKAEIDALRQLGVDGIITDYPNLF